MKIHPLKGIKQTAEHIAKRAAAQRGKKRKPLSEARKQAIREQRLGYKFPPEFKEKMRQVALNRPTSFQKGLIPWNKNQKRPDMAGENHPFWKGGITSKSKLQRSRFKETIQKEVLKRDNYTCQLCGTRSGNGKKVILHVDHIQSWADYEELRFAMENCRTLCMQCHYRVTYGKAMPKNIKSWGNNFSRSEGAT